jgi:FkbM family methyltransferase
MPPKTPETLVQRVVRRLGWAVRDRFPMRPVTRTVQGVEMVLPWSHRLPDYARVEPEYGQNLPRLAAALAKHDGRPVVTIDIGANVGDSALQILDAAPGSVLCVEGDDAFLEFLHRNVDARDDVAVEPSLLLPYADDVDLAPVRGGGTTRFEPGQSTDTMPTITVDELRKRHPDFDQVRLVKSDTDGYDVTLVPAVARTWADTRPVLFFEYHHDLTRLAGYDPLTVWDELAGLGYAHVRVWDNGSRPVGSYPIEEMVERSAYLDTPLEERPYHFWDVAVVHQDDEAGLQAVRDVLPPDPAA